MSDTATIELPPALPKDALQKDWAPWVARLGKATGAFKVFPLPPGQKDPPPTGWQTEASNQPSRIEAWWEKTPDANIGIAIQRGFLAFDLDIRDPEVLPKLTPEKRQKALEAAAAYDAFVAEHGEFQLTLEFASGTGGRHFIYRLPDGVDYGNSVGGFRKMGDVRGGGSGYLVAPGSDVDGRRYDVVDDCPVAPTLIPECLKALLNKREEYTGNLDGADTISEARLRLILANVSPYHRGDWLAGIFAVRSATVLKADRTEMEPDEKVGLLNEWASGDLWANTLPEQRMRDFDAGNYQGYDDIERTFNGKEGLGPKLAVGTLVRTARDIAAKEGRTLPPSMTRQGAGELFPDRTKTVAQSIDQTADNASDKRGGLHRFGDKPYGNRRWLVHRVLPETGAALLSGQWTMGKSITGADLSVSVMFGQPFASYEVDRRSGVLWLAAEGEAEVEDNIQAALDARPETKGTDVSSVPFFWREVFPQLLAPGAAETLTKYAQDAADEMAAEGVELGLIIVDTLAASAGWDNENDAAQGQRAMNVLKAVSKATGALVVAIDHYGKDQGSGTRGTTAKDSAADAILVVLGDRADSGAVTNRRMVLRKVRGGAAGAEHPFTLRVMELGMDEKGRPATAATVRWASPADAGNPFVAKPEQPARKRAGRPQTVSDEKIMAAIRKHLTGRGATAVLETSALADGICQTVALSPRVLSTRLSDIKRIEGAGFDTETRRWGTHYLSPDDPFAPVGAVIIPIQPNGRSSRGIDHG